MSTPRETVAEALARAVADALYETSITGAVYDVTVLRRDETYRDLAERIGSIAAEGTDTALASLRQHRDDIARVLHADDVRTGRAGMANLEDMDADARDWYFDQADAVLDFLTGGVS